MATQQDVVIWDGTLHTTGFIGTNKRFAVLTRTNVLIYEKKDSIHLLHYPHIFIGKSGSASFELTDSYNKKNLKFVAENQQDMELCMKAIRERSSMKPLKTKDDPHILRLQQTLEQKLCEKDQEIKRLNQQLLHRNSKIQLSIN
eukprot:108178_1